MLFENVYSTLQIMQENKRLNKYPVTLNGIRTWWCQLLTGGGVSLHLLCDWLQMISETRRTSVETHFMSTVRADNFCPMDHLQCLKVNLLFISPFYIYFHFRFSVHRVFPERQPASSSSSSDSLWIKTTGATDGHKSNNMCFFFLFLYRALKER